MLWWEVVSSRGRTGWQVIPLTRKRWPDALAEWLMLSIWENFDFSANMTFHRLRVPLLCLEMRQMVGGGLYLCAAALLLSLLSAATASTSLASLATSCPTSSSPSSSSSILSMLRSVKISLRLSMLHVL